MISVSAVSCVLLALLAHGATGLLQGRTPGPAPAGMSLQMTSPGRTDIVTNNQARTRRASTASISDNDMRVAAGPVTFAGIAPGMRNVAVIVEKRWHLIVPDAAGNFSAVVDLSTVPAGPLVVDVHAWDTPPDVHNFSVALSLRVHLFVHNTTQTAAAEQPSAVTGRRLVWSEEFNSLSRERWYAGPKPDGQEYGAAAFLGYDDLNHDPYTVMDGFLRIRARHLPDFRDQRGWGRQWATGHLSTGFPDGSATGAFRKGYFEARMMLPAGAGTWGSFWLLDQKGITASEQNGAVEIDVFESYGHDTSAYVATEHDWPPPSANGAGYRRAQKHVTGLADYSLRFHRFGIELTDTQAIFYLDGVEKFRTALYRAATVSPFFMMVTLAMSHDWPIEIPPSGYYDLWIDYVRVYE